eukprot:185110_1
MFASCLLFFFMSSLFWTIIINAQQEEAFHSFDFDQPSGWHEDIGSYDPITHSYDPIVWENNQANCPRSIAGDNTSPSAKSCVRLVHDAFVSRVTSTVGYHSIHLQIDVKPMGVEKSNGDWCIIQYRTSTTNWVNTNIIQGDQEILNFDVPIPDTNTYNNEPSFEVKVGILANAGGDICFCDTLKVFGIPCTSDPTNAPTKRPTYNPSTIPTKYPTKTPSKTPSLRPTTPPSVHPSSHPTAHPSSLPTAHPSIHPSSHPTAHPSKPPSLQPTLYPTIINVPSTIPTNNPTNTPTKSPSLGPTAPPSIHHTRGGATHDKENEPGIDVVQVAYIIIGITVCCIVFVLACIVALLKETRARNNVSKVMDKQRIVQAVMKDDAREEGEAKQGQKGAMSRMIVPPDVVPPDVVQVISMSEQYEHHDEGINVNDGGMQMGAVKQKSTTSGGDLSCERMNNVNIADDEFIIHDEDDTHEPITSN